MTPDEARGHFATAPVARLATVTPDGHPHLVPVVFALAGDLLVTAIDHKPKRSTRLARLANIAAEPRVSLLTDRYEEDWDALWWARADGRARVLPPPDRDATAARHAALLASRYPAHYAGHRPSGPVVEVAVRRWSGWRAT